MTKKDPVDSITKEVVAEESEEGIKIHKAIPIDVEGMDSEAPPNEKGEASKQSKRIVKREPNQIALVKPTPHRPVDIARPIVFLALAIRKVRK